jgi:hypothetical protein
MSIKKGFLSLFPLKGPIRPVAPKQEVIEDCVEGLKKKVLGLPIEGSTKASSRAAEPT